MNDQRPKEVWQKVFEGDVWQAHIVHSELEGEGVPAIVTEPHFYTPNPEVSGLSGGASSVFVAPERLEEARRIVDHASKKPKPD